MAPPSRSANATVSFYPDEQQTGYQLHDSTNLTLYLQLTNKVLKSTFSIWLPKIKNLVKSKAKVICESDLFDTKSDKWNS